MSRPDYRVAYMPDGTVCAVAYDEGQSGSYCKEGTWADFTVTELPAVPPEMEDLSQEKAHLLKVQDGKLVFRSRKEVSEELATEAAIKEGG